MPLGVVTQWRSPRNPGQAATSMKVFPSPSAPLPSPLSTAQITDPEQCSGSSLISASCITPAAEVTTKFNLVPPSVLPDMLSLSLYQNERQICSAEHHALVWPSLFRRINCGPSHMSGALAKSWGRLEQGPLQPLWDDAMPCSSCKVTKRLPRKLASPLNEWCYIKNKHNQPLNLPVLNSALLNPVIG